MSTQEQSNNRTQELIQCDPYKIMIPREFRQPERLVQWHPTQAERLNVMQALLDEQSIATPSPEELAKLRLFPYLADAIATYERFI